MSITQASFKTQAEFSFTESPSLSDYLQETLSEVSDVIAPVWPLKDYVAVNPYAGITHRSFADAREFLRVFSDCETLMPMEHYAAEFASGRITRTHIESAMGELATSSMAESHFEERQSLREQIVQRLQAICINEPSTTWYASTSNAQRTFRTIAEHLSSGTDFDWTETIVEEVSKHCAAHYDQEQATWLSPHADLSLYEAWRRLAERDVNVEILGLRGFRRFVAKLPQDPESTIAVLLQLLNVPPQLWSPFLLSQAFSLPGWSAWTKYQSSWSKDDSRTRNDFVGLLAIRLAYDAALAISKSLSIRWDRITENDSTWFRVHPTPPGEDTMFRHILLRASEIAYRNDLLKCLTTTSDSTCANSNRKRAQMVFCIDVRSERIRRHIESQSNDIETYGFAGFFGMAFEFQSLGTSLETSQLPVLLKPQFKVLEGIRDGSLIHEVTAIEKRKKDAHWKTLWKSFQTSAVSCFAYVESAGLFSGLRIVRRSIHNLRKPMAHADHSVCSSSCSEFGPTLRGLDSQGISISRLADLAEGMLRNLGLTRDFAKFVIFCGHASQTENNPLAASLDCGACGGHSGEPNARFAALLMNQPTVRQELAERGIAIPYDTRFLAALHNTTTDGIEFFDVHELSPEATNMFRTIQLECSTASVRAQQERRSTLPNTSRNSTSRYGMMHRAMDWSEVRPEWGLAGNAAFIVARRSLTQQANLNARTFLHSYDYRQDSDGKALETIMTAPMIVAHWINMQYYASTVDQRHFGSGTKTIHNVVGGFGIQSGNGGDLQTGMPWQSIHTGSAYQHVPLRLQVVIEAPREKIDQVIAKHENVSNLLRGGWLHLISLEGKTAHRYSTKGRWVEVDV